VHSVTSFSKFLMLVSMAFSCISRRETLGYSSPYFNAQQYMTHEYLPEWPPFDAVLSADLLQQRGANIQML